MPSPRLLLLAFPLAALVACGSGAEPSAGSSSEQALGEPETAGFVAPDLDPAHERDVFARYTHLDPSRIIADNLLFDAVTYYDANVDRLKNKDHIAIVDFAKHSGKKRLYVVDMKSGAVAAHTVAHGSGSEDGRGYATRFSDSDGSHMSSLGFAVTGSTFSGTHGRSLLLFGLSSTNAHMRAREIIVHSADSVHETSSRQGNSWGCFALDQRVKDEVVTQIMNGGLLYANLGKPNGGDRPSAAPAVSPTPDDQPVEDQPIAPTAPEPGQNADGAACTSDGACNPGADGSGLVCDAGRCVPGCHTDEQCPSSSSCVSGTCR